MNVFIFVDVTTQIYSSIGPSEDDYPSKINKRKSNTQKDSFSKSGYSNSYAKLVGTGGFRNRRITFLNRNALLAGIRYGECWYPCEQREVICLSKREVNQARQILMSVAKFIELKFGPCDQRETGFFGFTISNLDNNILMKRLIKIKEDIERTFKVECFLGAAFDPMIARLSCLMAEKQPRITTYQLLKSLMSQVPLKLYGIPRKLEKSLKDKSIDDSKILRNLSLSELKNTLDIKYKKYALNLFRLLRGIDPYQKKIKPTKSKVSHILQFEEEIVDPYTLYLSIENRWNEFKDFVYKTKLPIRRLQCQLISPDKYVQKFSLFKNTTGVLPHRINWRKKLRDTIYGADISHPILAVNLIAEIEQPMHPYFECTQNFSNEINRDDRLKLNTINLNNLKAHLAFKRDNQDDISVRFKCLKNAALRHNQDKLSRNTVDPVKRIY